MNAPKTLAEVHEALCEPFPVGEEMYRAGPTRFRNRAKWTKPMAYIDARCVFERLDKVVGPDNWSTRLTKLDNGAVVCEMTVLGVTKSDIGWVNRKTTNKEGEVDPDKEVMNEKGSASDAIKRAAVQFGIGRYLYAIELDWTPMVDVGNNYWVLPDDYRPPHAGGVVHPDAPRATMADAAKPKGKPEGSTVAQIGQAMDQTISAGRLRLINTMISERGLGPERVAAYLERNKLGALETITNGQASAMIDDLKKMPRIDRKGASEEASVAEK